LYLCTKKERKKYRMDKDFWVNSESEVLNFLRDKFGYDNVKFI
jgi:DNA polymerase-3 subunit alpha